MGWLDVAIGALLAGFGICLAVVLLGDGGSAVEIALVLVLFGAVAGWWMWTSFGWDTLRGRRSKDRAN